MSSLQQLWGTVSGGARSCGRGRRAQRGAHVLLLITEWEEFHQLDLARLRDLMEVPVLVDGRNTYDPSAAREAGFEYVSIGRDAARHPALRSSAQTVAARGSLLTASKGGKPRCRTLSQVRITDR